MDFEPWHHWLLLRPLFVFLLACPTLILAVFVGWDKEQRDAKRAREAASGRIPMVVSDAADSGQRACL